VDQGAINARDGGHRAQLAMHLRIDRGNLSSHSFTVVRRYSTLTIAITGAIM
jgi:hypothetical protein